MVEDGTGGDPTANSYVSLAEFVAYFSVNGFDFTALATPAIERSIVQATNYIELVYGRYFVGYLTLNEQPLSWPRTCAYRLGAGGYSVLIEGVPKEVKNATFEYAKRILSDVVLMPDPANFDETGLELAKNFRKIGPIEVRKDYFQGSSTPEVRGYPAADKWLEGLVRGMHSRSIRA
jgi:hypothetical protein